MEQSISATGHVKKIEQRLRDEGFELSQYTVADIATVIGKKKQFKMSWLATQQNIFVVVGSTDKVLQETIDSFSKASMEYALTHYKGLPRGFQTGVACFPLLVAPQIDESAKTWAIRRPRKHFAAFEMPSLFDSSKNTLYYYQKTPLWGWIYYKSFRKIISQCFNP